MGRATLLLLWLSARSLDSSGPRAVDDAFSTAEDTRAIVSPGVLRNDERGTGALHAVLVTRPAHGVLDFRPDGSFTYTPARDFNGVDFFSYRASDGSRLSSPAVVAMLVTPVNDRPVALDDSLVFSGPGPVSLNVVANDFDVDGEVLPRSVYILSPPRRGTVRFGLDGLLTYTPRADFEGVDSFRYSVGDDEGRRSNPATVRLIKQ